MNRMGSVLIALMVSGSIAAETITVQKVQGDVRVRKGVTEVWNAVASGDILRPHDTMRTGADGNAVIVVRADSSGETRRIVLPALVMLDISDIRDLSQEELMLKLTMEKVRASSQEWKNGELRLPNAAVVHGEARTGASVAQDNDSRVGELSLNGARVLFNNRFYATTVLRTMEVFRAYPALGTVFDHRLLLAQAMERANLLGEALAEYGGMLRMEGATAEQQRLVQERMRTLRQEQK